MLGVNCLDVHKSTIWTAIFWISIHILIIPNEIDQFFFSTIDLKFIKNKNSVEKDQTHGKFVPSFFYESEVDHTQNNRSYQKKFDFIWNGRYRAITIKWFCSMLVKQTSITCEQNSTIVTFKSTPKIELENINSIFYCWYFSYFSIFWFCQDFYISHSMKNSFAKRKKNKLPHWAKTK